MHSFLRHGVYTFLTTCITRLPRGNSVCLKEVKEAQLSQRGHVTLHVVGKFSKSLEIT